MKNVTTSTLNKDAASKRWKLKDDENVYVFEDGKTWMAWEFGESYRVHTTVDGRDCSFIVRGDGITNTQDVSVFTIACETLEKLSSGWRPINWR